MLSPLEQSPASQHHLKLPRLSEAATAFCGAGPVGRRYQQHLPSLDKLVPAVNAAACCAYRSAISVQPATVGAVDEDGLPSPDASEDEGDSDDVASGAPATTPMTSAPVPPLPPRAYSQDDVSHALACGLIGGRRGRCATGGQHMPAAVAKEHHDTMTTTTPPPPPPRTRRQQRQQHQQLRNSVRVRPADTGADAIYATATTANATRLRCHCGAGFATFAGLRQHCHTPGQEHACVVCFDCMEGFPAADTLAAHRSAPGGCHVRATAAKRFNPATALIELMGEQLPRQPLSPLARPKGLVSL